MKKLLLAACALCLTAGAARAELSVRGSLIAYWIPYQVIQPAAEGAETLSVSGVGTSGGDQIEALLDFSGQLENRRAGFRTQLRVRGGTTFGTHENVLAWVKLFDWMRIDVGKMKIDDNYALPVWYFPTLDMFMLKAVRDNDLFSNYEANNGILLRVTPIKNLALSAFLYKQSALVQGLNSAENPYLAKEDAKRAWERIQGTIAYTIPDVGFARLQYFGTNIEIDSTTHEITAPRLEAAFAYTGLKNLTLDVGGKYTFPLKDPVLYNSTSFTETTKPGTYQAPHMVSIGALYEIKNVGPGSLLLQGRAGVSFWGWYQEPNKNIRRIGPEVRASLWPAYKVDTYTFQLGTTLVYQSDWIAYGRTQLRGGLGYSAGLSVQKTFAPGCGIIAGFAYSGGEGIVFPSDGNYTQPSTADSPGKLAGVFSVPVRFAFFF
ncbi:MAG: hypothetical protein LBR16_07115 [Treponema sp.]|jgi:hypothetical protein|nr:hypothetical protein [Treponema sp.]